MQPFVITLALLAVLEIAARLTSPWRDLPDASRAVSNPASRRGWPEFLDSPPADRPLVIVISNSQAQALDTPDPEARWVGLLQKALPLRVENWSSEGILTGEIEILTVEATRRQPQLIVYVLGLNNFDGEKQVSLARAGSDIGVWLGRPWLWPALSQTLLWKNSPMHDVLLRTVYASSALARRRIAIEDDIGLAIDKQAQKAWFGRFLDLRPGAPPLAPPMADVIGQAARLSPRAVPEEAGVRDVAALIARQRGETKVAWVWMPVSIGATTPRLYRDATDVYARAKAPLEAAGARVSDLTATFPDGDFQTQFHLNAAGHRRMAEAMLPIVSHALR